jgi:hypothetical protein
MNLVSFHRYWFGKDPNCTPDEYIVTPKQVQLYEAFPEARGFSSTEKDFSLFLATFVLVLGQIRPNIPDRAALIVPKGKVDWSLNQMKQIVAYMLEVRKGQPENRELVRDVVRKVFIYRDPLRIEGEPKNWAAFGLCKDKYLPHWISDRLI